MSEVKEGGRTRTKEIRTETISSSMKSLCLVSPDLEIQVSRPKLQQRLHAKTTIQHHQTTSSAPTANACND